MALSSVVMLRHCTHLSEARYAAGMEVNYIGFLFGITDTDNYRSSTKAIYDWVAGIELVAELTEPNQTLVDELQATYQPAIWMVPAAVLPLLPADAKVVLMGPDLGDTRKVIGYLRNEDEPIGEGQEVWLAYNGQISLEQAKDVAKVLVLTGLPEERPGFADLSHLADILEELEIEN